MSRGGIESGQLGKIVIVVGDEHSAVRYGNPGFDVLASPALIGFFEAAAIAALAPSLTEGQGSVGVHIEMDHLAPTPVGGEVVVEAEIAEVRDREIAFDLRATDSGQEIARGRHRRFLVDRERFMSRLARS